MATVLALEPDNRRTEFLRAIVCEQVRASLVVADTKDAAVAAISARIPDVVLVSHNFPPRDEVELKDYLRSLRSAALEILRMPAPSQSAPRSPARTGLLGAFRRRAATTSAEDAEKDDGTALAGRIASALERVRSAREKTPTWSQPAAEVRFAPGPGTETSIARGFPKRQETSAGPRLDAVASAAAPRRDESRTAARAKSEERDENQDEWGFFDPSRCGYAALAATLDTLPEEVQEIAELSPADLLLQFGTEQSTSARGREPANDDSPSRPQQAVSVTRRERKRDRPAPLALWAHLLNPEGERRMSGLLLRYTEAIAGVAALLVGLNLPPQIAAVEYASGCRIHRIRGLAGTELTAPAISGATRSEPGSPSASDV